MSLEQPAQINIRLLQRSMISERRWHDLAICFCGVVAIPSRSPDRPDAGRVYHTDNGDGAIPNVRASLAIELSGAPSGNLNSAAKPAVVTLRALTCN